MRSGAVASDLMRSREISYDLTHAVSCIAILHGHSVASSAAFHSPHGNFKFDSYTRVHMTLTIAATRTSNIQKAIFSGKPLRLLAL